MLDSSGRLGLGSGLFNGDLVDFGNYEECINIEAERQTILVGSETPIIPEVNLTLPAFKGQYLLARIRTASTASEAGVRKDLVQHWDKRPISLGYHHSTIALRKALEKKGDFFADAKHGDYGTDFGIDDAVLRDFVMVSILLF